LTPFRRGEEAAGVIRVERARLAGDGGEYRLPMSLKSASYLGERWEYLLAASGLQIRV
jgi:hypothetical protein